jgi:hypothetical protein
MHVKRDTELIIVLVQMPTQYSIFIHCANKQYLRNSYYKPRPTTHTCSVYFKFNINFHINTHILSDPF